MKKAISLLRSFRDEEEGAAMIEYTILLGIITVAVIVSIIAVGNWVGNQWSVLVTELGTS